MGAFGGCRAGQLCPRPPLSATIHLQATEHRGPTGINVRTRITEVAAPYLDEEPQNEPGHSLCVMFLHDLREIEAQLRTEKLASMGRMSAAVAHEIRNPLAAITQANALLAEDLVSQPGPQQLCRIVGQNADRLARIAEEILNLARVQQGVETHQGQSLPLDMLLAQISHEWRGQSTPSRQILLQLNASTRNIVFDEEHLRRVLINLLDNASATAVRRAMRPAYSWSAAMVRSIPRCPACLRTISAGSWSGATAHHWKPA